MNLKNESTAHLHGGNLIEESKRLCVNRKEILDASASLVPFQTPSSILNCLIQAIEQQSIRYYPDRTHNELKESIGNWHDIDPSMVLPGNGAAELFTWAAKDAAELGISCLPSPGFNDYLRALNCWSGQYFQMQLPLNINVRFPQDFPLKPKTNVLWVTNPHNPTGHLWNCKSIEKLIKEYDLVICDEAFLPLVPNGENESVIPLIKNYPNLIVIRSLTKLFSIAGLRLGYALGEENRLERWSKYRDPWPLNSLAITAGIEIFKDKEMHKQWLKKIHFWIKEEGRWMHQQLESINGLQPHPSATNFKLIKANQSLNYLRKELALKKILLRDCRSFNGLGEHYLRISLLNRLDNQRVINAIKEILL